MLLCNVVMFFFNGGRKLRPGAGLDGGGHGWRFVLGVCGHGAIAGSGTLDGWIVALFLSNPRQGRLLGSRLIGSKALSLVIQ